MSFVPGVHGGAPPDLFFASGQDWGFHPLHPERIREDGYRFVSAALARAFRHADCVRIDHVMGLQRLYMIPDGCDAARCLRLVHAAEELHALVALEAHRAGAVVVGEDLGTVPDGVRGAWPGTACCARGSSSSSPRPKSPPLAARRLPRLARAPTTCPRFGAFLWGDDIDERSGSGALDADQSADERAARAGGGAALLTGSGRPGAARPKRR